MIISKQTIQEKPGIYFIRNLINNKIYIGQSKNIYRRAIHHRFKLNNNKHSDSHLQYSYNKYQQENFLFGILEYCNISILTEREKYHISNQKVEIYNVRDAEDTPLRKKRVVSEQQKINISNRMKGKIPKNYDLFREKRKRKINYLIDDKIIKTFSSSQEAADYFKMDNKLFNKYIGRLRVGKSKYFKKNETVEYYE